MQSSFKEFPLLLHTLVIGKLKIALRPLVTILGEYRNQVGEQQSVHALTLKLGTYRHKQKDVYKRQDNQRGLNEGCDGIPEPDNDGGFVLVACALSQFQAVFQIIF